jgi:hypothetical protein
MCLLISSSKDANNERNKAAVVETRQLLPRLQLTTWRATAGVAALVIADEDITAARSQPCAGSYQHYA